MEFRASFPNEESAIKFYEKIRWKDGVVSPFDATSKVYKCANGKYKCKNTGKYFTYRTKTFFANSKLGMRLVIRNYYDCQSQERYIFISISR